MSSGRIEPEVKEDELKKNVDTEKNTEPKLEKSDVIRTDGNSTINLLILLDALTNASTGTRRIIPSSETLAATGHGPGEWDIKITDKFPTRYEVIVSGKDKKSYVICKPLYESKFIDIDSLIETRFQAFEIVKDLLFTLGKEPDSVVLGARRTNDPNAIGIPMSELTSAGVKLEHLTNALEPVCSVVNAPHAFFVYGYVFTGIYLDTLQREAFDVMLTEMPKMQLSIERQLLLTQDGQMPSKIMPAPNSHTMFKYLANPFSINSMFERLPRGFELSAALVIDLLGPDMNVKPVPLKTLTTNASLSGARAGVASQLLGIEYSASMAPALIAYTASKVMPGMVRFEVDLEDLGGVHDYTRGIAALLCKLMFAYSEGENRYSDLTVGSVIRIEQAIATLGSNSDLLDHTAKGDAYPLSNTTPGKSPGRNRSMKWFHTLQTHGKGGGWREGGRRILVSPKVNSAYPHCCDRSIYITPLDDLGKCDESDILNGISTWETYRGVEEFVRLMCEVGSVRHSLNGILPLIKIYAQSIFESHVVFNDYNRKTWMTSLRPTNDLYEATNHDQIYDPCVVPISGATIFYIAKALNLQMTLTRRMDYLAQVSLESALAKDCVESCVRSHIFNSVIERYHIPVEHFKKSEIVSMIAPKKGPIAAHMKALKDMSLLSEVRSYFECAYAVSMTPILLRAVDYMIEAPTSFGVCDEVILKHVILRNMEDRLKRMSDDSTLYINVFNPGDMEQENHPRVKINLDNMRTMIEKNSARSQICNMCIDQVVVLNIPLPLTVGAGRSFNSLDIPFVVDYAKANKDKDIRKIFKMLGATLQFTSVMPEELRVPDDFVTCMNPVRLVHMSPDVVGKVIMSSELWLSSVSNHANRVLFVKTSNIEIMSVLARN